MVLCLVVDFSTPSYSDWKKVDWGLGRTSHCNVDFLQAMHTLGTNSVSVGVKRNRYSY